LELILTGAKYNYGRLKFQMSNLTAFDIISLKAYSFTVIANSITGIDTPNIEAQASIALVFLCSLYGGLCGAALG